MKLHIKENYEISKNTYEYCLRNFMYPNYDKVSKGTIYHNTHLEYVDSIAHNGILISKAKQLEYSGNMTWATTLPNQKGYGGCTVAFTLDGLEDRYDYEMVNNTEYCIYKDIPAENILFIDLPVVDGSGIGLTRLSDIPELIDEYGFEKVQKVFNKYGDKYIPLEDILPYLKLTNSTKEDLTLKHDKSTSFADNSNVISLIPATDEDLDLIIEAELFTTSAAYNTEELPQEIEDEIIQDSKDSLSHTRIILYNEEPIGILQAYELEEYWYIGEIYLKEEYRGQGIGREVLKYEINNHKDMTICLNVYKNNAHAIELYKSLGFEITEDDEDRYIMKLFPETNERVDIMKLHIKESISGRIEDTNERCVMEPTGYWIGANGRRITSYERVDKEIEYDKNGNPVNRQYSMDRQHRFWIETEDRIRE